MSRKFQNLRFSKYPAHLCGAQTNRPRKAITGSTQWWIHGFFSHISQTHLLICSTFVLICSTNLPCQALQVGDSSSVPRCLLGSSCRCQSICQLWRERAVPGRASRTIASSLLCCCKRDRRISKHPLFGFAMVLCVGLDGGSYPGRF